MELATEGDGSTMTKGDGLAAQIAKDKKK